MALVWLVAAVFALPVVLLMKRALDFNQYNGAPLLGLKGLVVKSHGSAKPEGIAQALVHVAYRLAERRFIETLIREIEVTDRKEADHD